MPRGYRGISRTERAAGAASFSQIVATQLRAGVAVLPARLVHHEIQPGAQRRDGGDARFRVAPSAYPAASRTRCARTDGPDEGLARRDYRDGGWIGPPSDRR